MTSLLGKYKHNKEKAGHVMSQSVVFFKTEVQLTNSGIMLCLTFI